MRTTTSTYYLVQPSGVVASLTVAPTKEQALQHFFDQVVATGNPICSKSHAEEYVLTADEYHRQLPMWRSEFCKAQAQEELA